MDIELYIPGIIAAAFAALTVLASWQAARPWNSVKIRMVPWRALIIVFGAVTIIALGFQVSQLVAR